MSDDGTSRHGRHAPDPSDDDLDRVFGPETASIPTRTRARTWFVIGGSVLVVAAVIAVVLGSIIGSVQNGIGGVFPRPDVALDRFDTRVDDLPGVIEVRRADSRIVRGDGTAHPRRFAVGPYTSNPFVGAFSRPRTNAVSFRENDAVALSTLRLVGDISRENQDREQHEHAAEHHHRRPVRQALGGLARQS